MVYSPRGSCLACSRTAMTFLIFKVAVLPLTKPDWAGSMIWSMMEASLVAIILERILTLMFSNETGLCEPGSWDCFPFFQEI